MSFKRFFNSHFVFGNEKHISFLQGSSFRFAVIKPSDSTTSWFTVLGGYVYHSDFNLLCSLVHSHLALYQVSVRRLVSLATRLPPSLSLLATTCRSLRLAVNTCGWI